MRTYSGINIASRIRSDAVLAAWHELQRLEEINAELLAACEEARANAGKYEDWLASRIGATYDALPNDMKFNLEEFGFFELIENAKVLREQLDTASAKAKGESR